MRYTVNFTADELELLAGELERAKDRLETERAKQKKFIAELELSELKTKQRDQLEKQISDFYGTRLRHLDRMLISLRLATKTDRAWNPQEWMPKEGDSVSPVADVFQQMVRAETLTPTWPGLDGQEASAI